MGTDFFDGDFGRERAKAMKVTVNGGGAMQEGSGGRDPSWTPADLSLTPLARRKQEVADQMADKVNELSRLKAQQEALEEERRRLEEQRARQEAYERGRAELKGRLERMASGLESERRQQERLASELSEARRQVEERLRMVEGMEDCGGWSEAEAGEAVAAGLEQLEKIAEESRELDARLTALRSSGGVEGAGGARKARRGGGEKDEFLGWVRMGAAFALPFLAAGLLLLIVGWLLFW